MLGAIIGDIVGSRFEFERNNVKTKAFGNLFDDRCRFTDDTVLTLATANALINKHFDAEPIDYALSYQVWADQYPKAGYGSFFRKWFETPELTINKSFGNGSAMRVSPIAWAFPTLDEVLDHAEKSCYYTHNHPEGIKGAKAIAASVFLAKNKASKIEIYNYLTEAFPDYNLNRALGEIRPDYKFDATCQGSVPEAIIAFLEADDFEDAIRNAISLGGDSDTIAAMTGSIAEAFFEIPENIKETGLKYLTSNMLNCFSVFNERIQNADQSSDL